jgi:predicted flap endonuclease-1-like 5' DNA nuclease
MWFLLLQIFLLMLLSAACGAALAWWWLSRRHEDLAASRERLVMQAATLDGLATREDLAKEVAAVQKLLGEQKPVNLLPMEERIARVQSAVSGIRVPEVNLAPLNARLEQMERRLSTISIDPVMQRVSDVVTRVTDVSQRVNGVNEAVGRIPATDLRPIDERLARLESAMRGLKLPDVDLGPVHTGIAALGLSVKALEPVNGRISAMESRFAELGGRLEAARRTDIEAITSRIATISNTLGALRVPDLGPLQARLSEIQVAVANIPRTDLSAVNARIAEVQAGIANIPKPERVDLGKVQKSLTDLETFVVALDKPGPDFGPLHSRFAALETALVAVQKEVREGKALAPIDLRIAGLEEALVGLPGPDLEPVLGAVRSIDSRRDLVAVENRLTAIEYGLAAVHHMLRSRTDGGEERVAPNLQVVREMPVPVVPTRPSRESDPINSARKADDRANLLAQPAFGNPDDLELIDGVGPILAALLNDIGVYYFWQVAEWTSDEIDWVESKLKHFRGRIRRDDWVGHARELAAAPNAAKRPSTSGLRSTF